MNKQESNSTVKKKKRKKRGTLKIEPGISAHPFKLSSRNVLAMMRLKWSVRAKVIIARGGGGSEDFGEDGVDYK